MYLYCKRTEFRFILHFNILTTIYYLYIIKSSIIKHILNYHITPHILSFNFIHMRLIFFYIRTSYRCMEFTCDNILYTTKYFKLVFKEKIFKDIFGTKKK